MKNEKAFYICDGCACGKQCAKTMTAEEWAKASCHHTNNENHAKNKVRRNRKFTCSGGRYIEVE